MFILLRLISVGILALWLAGCAPETTAAPASDLVIAVPNGVPAKAAAAYAAWFQQQTGARVQVDKMGADQYDDLTSAALLSGSDRYDLVYLNAENLGKWAAYHALEPLQNLPDSQALAPWLDVVSIDGQVYGVPTQPDPMVLWYRVDMFRVAGIQPPGDWEAFRAAAEALNQPPDHFGVVLPGSDADAADAFSAVLAGFGGQAVTGAHQMGLNTSEAQRAMELYAGLHTVDRVTPPDVENYSAFEVLAALQNGQVAMGIAPLSASSTLLNCKASPRICEKSYRNLMWYAWLPGLSNGTGAGDLSAWAVPLHARHPQAAQDFAARLASLEGAKAWASGEGTPALRAAFLERELASRYGADYLAHLDRYLLAVPPLSTGDQVLKAYDQAVHQAVAGKQAPGQALEQAAVEIKKALRQGGY